MNLNPKSLIPNLLTLANLLCGCAGIVLVFSGQSENAAVLIWIAAVFDFLDGAAARLLKVSSVIGKELDSLADMITFGVLPSMIMYHLISELTNSPILPWISFSIALFSALRLAKFNTDDRQSEQFIGLPTPANAFFISALPFMLNRNFKGLSYLLNAEALAAISIILSLLLVARLPLISLKFKNFTWKQNAFRYIFLAISAVMLLVWNVFAIPGVIIIYILLSLLSQIIRTKE